MDRAILACASPSAIPNSRIELGLDQAVGSMHL